MRNWVSARKTLVCRLARLARRNSRESSWPLTPAAAAALLRLSEEFVMCAFPLPPGWRLGPGRPPRRSEPVDKSDSEFKVMASTGQVHGLFDVQNQQQAIG